MSTPATAVVIGLSAVVVAVRDREAVALTVRTHDPRTGEPSSLLGLPFGPFDPDGHRTFELALRAFVTQQTRFELGYVEQLYTFGDRGRDAPRADVGAGAARVISVGYLALTPQAVRALGPDTVWTPLTRFFPWEDWRRGRPALIDEAIAPRLADWASTDERRGRMRLLFALGSVAILAALLYFQYTENGSSDSAASDYGSAEPGYAAVRAQLIETGEDGLPLYRLDAERIEQPRPRGTILLTEPKLDYQPEAGNHWTLTAQHGQMPQDAVALSEPHAAVHRGGAYLRRFLLRGEQVCRGTWTNIVRGV